MYVGILRYVKYSEYRTSTDWHGGMCAALQSHSLGSVPSAVILFFLVFLFTLFLQQNLNTFYFFSLFTVLCHLFSLTLSLITVNVGRCQAIYNSCSVTMYVL